MEVVQGAFGVGRTPVLKPADPSPEDQARDVEKKVHEILEESALQAQLGDFTAGGVFLPNNEPVDIWKAINHFTKSNPTRTAQSYLL